MLDDGGDYSTCLQYDGAASTIDTIRDASDCTGQGGTELDACPTEGGGFCTTSQGEMSNSTYYYGLTADDVESYATVCEALGGTFTPP
jgi:hypothetical protein